MVEAGHNLTPGQPRKIYYRVDLGCALCGTPCDSANVLLYRPSYGQQRADLRAAMAGQGLVLSIDNLFNHSREARGWSS